MLELLFRGFFEWIYSLIVDIWGFIAGGLLDIMGLDFAYIQSHIPIMDDMARVLMAAGWALLLGNLVFQALKSMAAGLGFEGEDPKLLFARTFVFAFLLLASPQICRIGLDLTSSIMDLLSIPDATNVSLVDESVFGTLTASWLMAIICSVIVMFKVLGLLIEIAERYVILAMLTLTAPLAFAMGGSKNTASIFTGWCRMFGSMCLLMVTNLVCFKMLFSVVSTVPSGLDVLPWMVLIFAIVKVAHKSDAIITRIGLNPAITGGPGRTLPGMLAYTVARTVAAGLTKGVTGGGGKTAAASRSAGRPGSTRFNGSRFAPGGGARFNGGTGAGGGRYSGSRDNAQSGGDEPRDGGRYGSHSTEGRQSAQQPNARQENPAQSSSRNSNTNTAAPHAPRGGGRPQHSRRSSAPAGAGHPRSYVPPAATPKPGAAGAGGSQPPGSPRSGPAGATPRSGVSRPGPAGATARSGVSHPGPAGATARSGVSRPGAAGTPPKTAAPKHPSSPRPGAAGTGASRQSTRATHSAGGSTVNSSSQTSTQTNVTMGGGRPGNPAAQAQPGPARTPRPGGPAVPASGAEPGKTRATRREGPDAAAKTPGAPAAPGVSQPGLAGKPSRSTQRPADAPPRPGRNAAPSSGPHPVGGTPSGPAPQERTHSPGRSTGNAPAPSPAPQERRGASAPAAPARTGGPPTARPGPAGTAPAAKQASGKPQAAKSRTTRAKPGYRPPPRPKGGSGHG